MKIRFLTGVSGESVNYYPGDEVDLPSSEARRWLMSGAAEAVPTDQAETAAMETPAVEVAPEQFKKKRRY